MALKIRMQQFGRTNRSTFRIVVADVRQRRDGLYIESLGTYNPFEKRETEICLIDPARLQYWLDLGAEPSRNVEILAEKVAPAVVKEYRNRLLARDLKLTSKRRERRQKKEGHAPTKP